jgi:Aspartyl/Asparaginyl beta-hydroxylase
MLRDWAEQCETGLPDRVRLPLDFDAAPLAAELARFEEGDWTAHFVRANYQGEWSAIPLRCAAGETHPSRMIGVHSLAPHFVDTRFLDRAPAFAEVLARLHCPLKSVRLMRLSVGSRIKEHEDYDPDAENGSVRLHVPVTTNDEVEFLLNRRPVAMAAGSVWYLNLAGPHSVANRGKSDRVHLVIDARVNDWLAGLVREGAAALAG